MKKIIFPAVIYFTALFTACSDSGSYTDPIQIPDNQKNQIVYADDTNREISFTATAAWDTQINYSHETKTTGTEAWINLDPPNGEAGEVTIKVTLQPNYSGKDRKATIQILCGGTIVTVIIEQKSETASGEIPVAQKKISRVEVQTTETWEENTYNYKEIYTFKYDTRGRLSEQCFQDNSGYETIHQLSYAPESQIKITEKDNDEYWIVSLNDIQATSKLEVKGSYGSDNNRAYTFQYDSENYLKQESWKDNDYSTNYIDYNWEKGDFTFSIYYSQNNNEDEDEDEIAKPDIPYRQNLRLDKNTWRDTLTSDYSYLQTPENNKSNLDPNLFISTLGGYDGSSNSNSYNTRKGRLDLLALWGFLGKRSQHYVNGPSSYEGLAFPEKPAEEYYYTYSYTCHPLHYAFDKEGYLLSVTDKADKKIYKVITATQEHIFIKETTDQIIYTFTYKN